MASFHLAAFLYNTKPGNVFSARECVFPTQNYPFTLQSIIMLKILHRAVLIDLKLNGLKSIKTNKFRMLLLSFVFIQKFRFCGDGDCPDWVLHGIHSNLSTLSSIKLRLLTQQVAKAFLGESSLNEDKLKDTFAVQKHDMDVPKAAVACLKFLLINAVRFDTDSATFNEELQQLGLPKEHANAICKVQDEFGGKIREQLVATGLTINEVEDFAVVRPDSTSDCLQLQFKVKNAIVDGQHQSSTIQHNINVCKSDAVLILQELRAIQRVMSETDYEQKYNSTASTSVDE